MSALFRAALETNSLTLAKLSALFVCTLSCSSAKRMAKKVKKTIHFSWLLYKFCENVEKCIQYCTVQ